MAFETRRRSVLKSLSWRFLAALITSSVVYALTGKGEFAAKVGLVDTAVKLFIYFLHERAWDRISYGRLPPAPDYEV
jgi:uncharacterized membrane protein